MSTPIAPVPTSNPADPTAIHSKVLNPALVTLALTLIGAILAANGSFPGVSDHGNQQWAGPLLTGITGLVQFVVGYMSPNKPQARP